VGIGRPGADLRRRDAGSERSADNSVQVESVVLASPGSKHVEKKATLPVTHCGQVATAAIPDPPRTDTAGPQMT
jgi:hypothetical protein